MSKEGYPSGGGTETYASESAEIFEVLNILNEIEAIISWLVEVGPSANPLARSVKRARLAYYYEQLGIDPSDPNAIQTVLRLRNDANSRARKPRPVINVPDVAYFDEHIARIRSERPIAPPYMLNVGEVPSLDQVSRYVRTDWNQVNSRASVKTDGEYMHGVATVMADPIAYHGVFLSRRPAGSDGMEIDTQWMVGNGRHRSLAVKCLGPDYIYESGMSDWVKVNVAEY